jgi:hypothetical protein
MLAMRFSTIAQARQKQLGLPLSQNNKELFSSIKKIRMCQKDVIR